MKYIPKCFAIEWVILEIHAGITSESQSIY